MKKFLKIRSKELAEIRENKIFTKELNAPINIIEKKVDWEIVKLENLPKWWEETHNSKWLRNNVMGENKKIINKDKFSQKQWEKMMNYLDKDIKFWKEI